MAQHSTLTGLAPRHGRLLLQTTFVSFGIAALLATAVCAARAQSTGSQLPGDQSLSITLGGDSANVVGDPAGSPAGAAAADAGSSSSLPPPDFGHLSVRAIGAINEDGAQIERRAAGGGVQVLFTCVRGQAVGVVGQIGDWYCVLMADRSVGCVPADRVTLTWNRPAPITGESTVRRELTPVIFPHDMHGGTATTSGLRVVDEAMQYLGVHYSWGGNTFHGIDCSGLVKNVFKTVGVDLPRTAHEQAQVGIPVALADIEPGDRLSFACHGSAIDHTGIYIGNGQFVHASGAKQQVCVSKLEGGYLRWLVGIHRDLR